MNEMNGNELVDLYLRTTAQLERMDKKITILDDEAEELRREREEVKKKNAEYEEEIASREVKFRLSRKMHAISVRELYMNEIPEGYKEAVIVLSIKVQLPDQSGDDECLWGGDNCSKIPQPKYKAECHHTVEKVRGKEQLPREVAEEVDEFIEEGRFWKDTYYVELEDRYRVWDDGWYGNEIFFVYYPTEAAVEKKEKKRKNEKE